MATPLAPEDDAFVAGMLAGVRDRFARPTDQWPSSRCIARPTLVRELGRLRDNLHITGFRNVTASAMLHLLERGGVVQRVPIEDVRKGLPADRLYSVGISVDPAQLDPIELLQAHVPRGVVCYFTALQIHDLTVQSPAYHHIAIPVRTNTRERHTSPPVDEESLGRVPPLGTREFTFQGLPYYSTSRDAHRLVGMQQRYLNERTLYRVTTLEQTLLDTLHRPHSCGGAPVVFEAWGHGVERLDPARLAESITRIGDARLARRVGYMLDRFNYRAPALLADALDTVISSSPADAETLPLIPGVPHTVVDSRWGVAAP